MKKQLLLGFGLISLFALKSQTCESGYSTNGIHDGFDSTAEVGDTLGGIYFWGEDALAGDTYPNHQSKLTRDSVNSQLDILFSQGQGEYIPFGASFGTTKDGKKSTIDIASNPVFEITITNHSDSAISVALSIEDSLGNPLNTYSTANPADFANSYQHAVTFNVEAKKTVTKSADFTGGYNANYTNSQLEQKCDLALIAGLSITVTNPNNTGDPLWAPLELNNLDISIDEITLGTCPIASSLKEANKVNFNLFPNPTTGLVNLQLENNDFQSAQIVLSNLLGETVKLTNINEQVAQLNYSDIPQGIYLLSIVTNKKIIGTRQVVIK